MTLVDDCIKRRFHSKQSTQMHIPLIRTASMKMNMEYIGPNVSSTRCSTAVIEVGLQAADSRQHYAALRLEPKIFFCFWRWY
jgi:hypothetical protein